MYYSIINIMLAVLPAVKHKTSVASHKMLSNLKLTSTPTTVAYNLQYYLLDQGGDCRREEGAGVVCKTAEEAVVQGSAGAGAAPAAVATVVVLMLLLGAAWRWRGALKERLASRRVLRMRASSGDTGLLNGDHLKGDIN